MKTYKEFLEAKGEEAEWLLDEKKGSNWISTAIKHKGRCTKGSKNFDCPKDSPQWRLAQRFRHGDLHHDKKKKD